MNKIVALILLVAILLSFSSCIKEEPQQTQEEFQMEYEDMMRDLQIKTSSENKYNLPEEIRTKIDETLYINHEELKIKLYLYEWRGEATNAPTLEEIINLYNEYNEEVYNRFAEFVYWYTDRGGNSISDTYRNAMSAAYKHYRDEHDNVMFNNHSGYAILENYKEMEEYLKENPDFEYNSKDYQTLLDWLGVERPEESATSATE